MSINPEKITILKDTYTPVFIAVLFTIARTWKQAKYPPKEEWIKKMCVQTHIHTHNRIVCVHAKLHTHYFPLVRWGCESWTIKKAECQRIDALELWCWRRLLRFPWTTRRPNQSILKEISPEYLLEELMLKLKLQYSGHLVQRTASLEKTPMLGKIEGRRRSERQRMRQLDGITDSMTWVWASSRSWWWTGKPVMLQSMGSQRGRHNWETDAKMLQSCSISCDPMNGNSPGSSLHRIL